MTAQARPGSQLRVACQCAVDGYALARRHRTGKLPYQIQQWVVPWRRPPQPPTLEEERLRLRSEARLAVERITGEATGREETFFFFPWQEEFWWSSLVRTCMHRAMHSYWPTLPRDAPLICTCLIDVPPHLTPTRLAGVALVSPGLAALQVGQLLWPVQRAVGAALQTLRLIQRIASWEYHFLTVPLYIGLLALSLVGAVLGYALRGLPWSVIFEWLARLLGAAVLGPHMMLIGWHLDVAARQEAQRKAAFEAGDKATRSQILEEEKAIIESEADREIARVVPLSKREAGVAGSLLVLQHRQFKALANQFRAKPLLWSSRAYPMADTSCDTADAGGC